jgi:hypothetical protein
MRGDVGEFEDFAFYDWRRLDSLRPIAGVEETI